MLFPVLLSIVHSAVQEACFSSLGNETWIFSSLYFLLFVIIPFTLATVLPVYALCYIRSNVMCENMHLKSEANVEI